MERANSRPLLMQQADSLVRAKRRALFRVRNALRQAGVRDVNRALARRKGLKKLIAKEHTYSNNM